MSNEITIENLSFSYPGSDKLVLQDVNMSVQEGDFVCLLGQSGCGKSTLLRLLAGLEAPTEGSIKVDGKEIKGCGLDRSVVFQDYGLFPWMSSGENVATGIEQRYPGRRKSEYKEMALDAIRAVGLPDVVYDKYPKELSGGMQQRCAIARSIGMDPSIFLMDEPFGALDAVTRARLQDLVLKLWKEEDGKKTVFFVTHDVEEALLLATRIFVFGQSPSKVIFSKEIPLEGKPGRHEMYEDQRIIKLRTELVSYINHDVMDHVEE